MRSIYASFTVLDQAAGIAQPSYTSRLLEDSLQSEDERDIKLSAAVLYAGA